MWKFLEKKNAKFSRKNKTKISRTDRNLKRYCGRTDRNLNRYLEKSNSLHQTFIEVKEEKLLIWHNKTSNIEVSEQRFFWAINCCSYNTHGFHEIFAFRIKNFRQILFSKISLDLFSKICEMWTKIFAKLSFAGNFSLDLF